MVALQFFNSAHAMSIHVKLSAHNSDPRTPKLYGTLVATFCDFVEMIDEDEDVIVEDEPRIPTDDEKVLQFTTKVGQLFYYGIVRCVEEMTNKGLYPKQYFDCINKLALEQAKIKAPLDLQFWTSPGIEEQEAMSAKEQLKIMADLCVVKNTCSCITIHLEFMGVFCHLYEQGHHQHNDAKNGPPSQIKIPKSQASNTSGGKSSGTPNKASKESCCSAWHHLASHHSGLQSNTPLKSSSKKSKKKSGLRPFKIPSMPLPKGRIFSPEGHCL
jgi:hypothetical protein